MSRTKCDRCQQPIVFYKSAASGKPMPIDPQPVDIGGNVYLSDGLAYVLKKGQTHPGPLYLTHFATCPKRTGNAPAESSEIVDPRSAVKRIRQEIEEERRAAKPTDEADPDTTQGRTEGRRDDPEQGALTI